jgi:hypothetical protein
VSAGKFDGRPPADVGACASDKHNSKACLIVERKSQMKSEVLHRLWNWHNSHLLGLGPPAEDDGSASVHFAEEDEPTPITSFGHAWETIKVFSCFAPKHTHLFP